MSKYQVIASLKARTPEGIRELQAGEIIALPEDMALRLIEDGKVKPLPRPYFDPEADIVIPFDSNSRYHWWAGGLSITETIGEIKGAVIV